MASADESTSQSVLYEGEPDNGFAPYLRKDVVDLAQIVIDSSSSDVVVAALLVDHADSTPESFKQSQRLLKETLQDELVDKNAGALKPEKTRLAKLLFQVDDGRLILDDDGVPIFRSGSDDGRTPALSIEVATEIVNISKARAEAEKGTLSSQLFKEVMGLSDVGEVESLKKLASLSSKIRNEFDNIKLEITETFQLAIQGTTEAELTATKEALEQRLAELNSEISEEESRKANAETTVANLNNIFREKLMDVDLAEELPDIDELVGGETSSLSVEALFQTIIDQFARRAEQEKARSSAQGLIEDLETQRLRAETLLENNMTDRNRILARIAGLNESIAEADAAILAAQTSRAAAEQRASQALTEKERAQDDLERYATAQGHFDAIMRSSSVEYSHFNSLDRIINSTSLQTAVTQHVNAEGELSSAQSLVTSAEADLRRKQTAENSAYSAYIQAQQTTRSKKSIYDNTSSKIGSGKSEKTNPDKETNRRRWESAKTDERNKKNSYDAAVRSRQSAQNLVNSRRTNRNSKENAKSSAYTRKLEEGRDFQDRLDSLVDAENRNKIEADYRRTEALTEVNGYDITIQNNTSTKSRNQAEIAGETTDLANVESLISVIEKQLDVIETKKEAADNAEADSAGVIDQEPSPSPEEESAAALQLRELMEQRSVQTDAIAAHSKKITQLRADVAKVQSEIETTTEELSNPPTDRDERRQMAEVEKEESLRQAISKTAEQLQAILTTAGYDIFGTWTGTMDEAISIPLLRLLVADVKELTTLVEIRRRPPAVPFEQLGGSEIEQVDVESVERIIQKLHAGMQTIGGSLERADPVDLLQAVESQVRAEFSSDLDVKPSECILVNTCSGDDGSWEDVIMNSSTTTTTRLVYQSKNLYDAGESSPDWKADWMVLESIVDNTSTPIEDIISDLANIAESDWALDACAKFLVESWLKHKSLMLANIEELGTLITKFEDLRANPDKSVAELDIFRRPLEIANDEVSFLVAKNTVERILLIRNAVLDSEKGVVDASEMDIVNISQSTKYNFDRFNKALSQRAISIISSEIVRRKTAILSGSTSDLGGAAAGEVAALEEQIANQQLAIDEAQNQMQGLQEEYQKALADAEASANIWTTYETSLSEKIDKLEVDLASKNAALAAALEDHAATEADILQQLEDSAKLREEIEVLDSQRTQLQDKVAAAQRAVETAQQDLNSGEGEVALLNAKRQNLESAKQSAEAKRDELREWIDFTRNIATELKHNHESIIKRSDLAKEYKALEGSEVAQQMFTLVGKYFPSLKAAADKFSASADSLKKLDLRQALDQHLVQYPSLDYQPKSTTLPGMFTMKGFSLSYTEVEATLLAFVTERCSRAGLLFGSDGYLHARDNSAIPNFESDSIPLPVRELIKNRILLFYKPDITGAVISWDEYLTKRPFKAAADMLVEMKEWCGISKWDVLHAYATTVEVIVANVLVVDKPVALPGVNLFVTAGEDIHVRANCDINTSPKAIQLRHSKARNGNDYPSDPTPNGRHGDNGLNAPAGLNAGHVTLNAHRNLTWDDTHLRIRAIGAVGSDGQDGGDGDKGRVGLKGKAAVPKETDGWGNRQVSWGWTRFPGCENDGSLSTKADRKNEISGPGGNGGKPGAGGQGGSGGEVLLMDQENPKEHIIPEASTQTAAIASQGSVDSDEGTKTVQFGNRMTLVTLRDGKDGKNATGIGKGGEGGDPGQRGIEKVYNKKDFFHKTKTETGYMREDYLEGLNEHVLPTSKQNKVNEDWGWSKYHYGYAYDPDDFSKRKYPWLSAADAEIASRSSMSRGAPGTPGGGSGGGGGAEHAKQRQRRTNANISAEDEYQRQKYQVVQTLQSEEEFASIDNVYTAQEQALQQQINALSTQLTTTTNHQQEAQESVNRMREREEQLLTESEELEQQLQVINSVISKSSSEVRASDKIAMSKIIASLQQSETIATLSQELQNITIDQKYDAKAINKLQTIAAGIQALQLAKQLEIQRKQELLQQEISELTAELLRTEQIKGQLANVNAVSSLDALLKRTESLQQEQITQQQQKQKSVQVEADPDADEIDHLVGTSILLSVRDTFARGEAPGSVWPALGNSKAKASAEAILAALPRVEEGKRAMTVELLEILIRYCLFTSNLAPVEGLSPLADPSLADSVVAEALRVVDSDLRWNHWFIGQMTGATLMITSSEGVTVDQASLTSRYEQVEGIAVFDSLTPLERDAAKLVNELETVGTNLQHIAQFLKGYHDTMMEAQLFTRQGYLSILQGNPVKLIDKLSRIILMFFRRNDDELAEQNLELAIGIAKTVRVVADSVGVYVLEAALTRIRDIRGGGGYTSLFLRNAESALTLLANGDSPGALLAMRNTDAPVEQATEYGPRTYSALLAEIDQAIVAASPAEIATKLTVVARTLGAGIAVRTSEEVMDVLTRVHNINFTGQDGALKNAAAWGPIAACATVGINVLSVALSDGDKSNRTVLRNAATSRLSVPYLPPRERVSRVLAFFRFVGGRTGQSPDWTIVQTTGGFGGEMEEDVSAADMNRKLLFSVLGKKELSYPARSAENESFVSSLRPSEAYEEAVERLAYNIITESPDYMPTTDRWRRVSGAPVLEDVLRASTAESPVAEFLVLLALETRGMQVVSEMRSQYESEMPSSILAIRSTVERKFENVADRTLVETKIASVVNSLVFEFPIATLQRLWQSASDPGIYPEELMLLAVAMIRSDENATLNRLREQLKAAAYMWRQLPQGMQDLHDIVTVLHEGTIAIVRTVTGNSVVMAGSYTTTKTSYVSEAVEGALSTLAAVLSDSPAEADMAMHATQLDLLSSINHIVHQNETAKMTLGHTKEVEERDDAYLAEDEKALKRVLMVCVAFVVSGSNPVVIKQSMTDATAEEVLTSEVELRKQLASALQSAHQLSPSQLALAQGLYITVIGQSSQRKIALIETNEVYEVVRSLLTTWKEDNNVDCRTAALAMLQNLVLEIRENERNGLSVRNIQHADNQDALVDRMKTALPTRTASTDGEESPALVSENERRVQFWYICLSQINDEDMRLQQSDSLWSPIYAELQGITDAEDFESTLASHANRVIFKRRSQEDTASGMPDTLKAESRSEWAQDNYGKLTGLISWARYVNFLQTPADFDYNVVLQGIVADLGLVLPEIQAKTKDEPETVTVDRCDTIAWILGRLADSYQGMHVTSRDEDLIMKISSTVEDLSRHGEYEKASAKLKEAIKRLITVLEHSNARMGRYSQIQILRDETYEASELKRRLDEVEETSALASQVVTMGARVSDLLINRDYEIMYTYADELRTNGSFGDCPKRFMESFNGLLALTGDPSNEQEAIKRLLKTKESSSNLEPASSLPSFKVMANISSLLNTADEEVHELVKSGYATVLSRLSGKMRFVLGMAQESDFNPIRGSKEQKALTKEEYNEAAKNGSDAAYNNMLCNSFAEARDQNKTFDEARALVMPWFLELTDEPKAAENIALLEEEKPSLQRYTVNPPADDTAEEENSIVFSKFDKSVRKLVNLLEQVIYAASSGSKAVLTLRHLLGERVDTLSAALENRDLIETTQHLDDFATETMQLIQTAPPFGELGGFSSTLSKLYAGTDLEHVPDYSQLLLALDDVSVISTVLFPRSGATIFNNSSAMSNGDVSELLQSLLPLIVDSRIQSLPGTDTGGKALMNRFTSAAVSELEMMQDSSTEDASQALERAQNIVNAMIFRPEDPLGASGISAEDLFTEAELTMFGICGQDSSFLVKREADGSSKTKPPFLWADELSKRCILRLLQRSSKAQLTASITKLRDEYWSASQPREQQTPLQLAEDEADKIEEAMQAIFNLEKIDSTAFSEQQFQNVFNASHYILYLTTARYIIQVRAPKRPDVPQVEAEQTREDKKALDTWDKAFKAVESEASEMVKKIKTAAQDLLDTFGVAKKIHERLIVVDTVFSENSAEAYKLVDNLLNLADSTPSAMERALWLLEMSDPERSKSLMEESLKVHDQTEDMSLNGIVLAVAFDLIGLHIGELCDMSSREGQEKTDAMMRVAALQQQSLDTEGGVEFAKFILSTTTGMISEAKEDMATNAASKEEVDSLLDSIQLAIETQAWRSERVMARLQTFATPSGWVPTLDAYSIAMALSYNPESTTAEDTTNFESTATSIQRLRSRRGARVANVFIECLQLLVASHADASTLATIAAAVSSNRWPFSASSKPSYEHASGLATNVDVLTYLETVASELKGSAGDRTVERLVEIMNEEVEGVNASIADLLSPISDDSISKIEQRVQTIFSLYESHTNADGKAIKKWKTDDIVEWSKEFKKVSKGYFTEDHTDKLDLMLAVFVRVVKKFKDYDIRNPQLLSIILFVDCMVQGKGQLGEIGTGEGKSLICLLCATARVFMGETVDIVTSSPVLAERDAKEAVEWFDYFDMTVHNNCDAEAEADPMVRQKRYREHAVIYGTTGAFERDILLTKYYNADIRNKPGDCLIVDEVDTLLIDSVANTLYISHDIQDLRHLNEIFVSIWLAVHGPDVKYYSESSVELVKQFIEGQITKGNIHVPSWLQSFMEDRLDMWIRNAYNAKSMEEGDQYTLYESGIKRGQVVVVDLYTGVEMPSTQWSNGLHQFVQLKHNNKLSAESLKAIFMANVNFVKMYGHRVIGMTGTLGSQSELDLLRRVYNTTAFRMPRYREERYYEEPAVVVGNRSRWLERVADEVVTQSNATEGYDVQRTIDDAEYQQKKLDKDRTKVAKLTGRIQQYEEEIKETEALERSLLARTVELSTPQDVDMRAINSLELLILDLKDSEFVDDGDAAYGEDRIESLTAAVSTMKAHLEAIAAAEAESSRLSLKVGNLEFEQTRQSMQGDTPSESSELDTAKAENAAAEEELLRLRNLSDAKGNTVLAALSSVQQGVSYLAEEHLKDVRKDLKEDELELEEEYEDVEKRTIKLASSQEALASGSGGRSVLVICRNKNDCEDVRDAVVARSEENLKLYVYTGTTEGITEVNQKTGKTINTHVNLTRVRPHDVIVATNIAGRGTSIKTTDVLEQCGGLHVVLSYVPSNIRVEMQAWGRTSRRGRNGSGRFVVYDARVTTSMQHINIDYLLSERDVLERERLEEIEVQTIPRVNLESILFERFSQMSETLKAKFKKDVKADLQQKELRDQWAFFLESYNDSLEDTYKHPQQSEAEILEALENFEQQQNEASTSSFGLISSPGNLLHIVSEALRSEDYGKAKNAAQAIIDGDKQYAAYGYYYHALSLFGSGTDNLQTKKDALAELEKAVFLLKRHSDKLQGQSQVISSINGTRQSEGVGTEAKAFEKSNSNTQSLIKVHVEAAEKLTGRALTEEDFNTSAINGDATKDVFDIFNDEGKQQGKLQKYVRPVRVTTTMEVRLRVAASTTKAKQEVQFLRDVRRGEGNRFLWDEDTLEIGDVTDAELERVQASDLPWELALYRSRKEFESLERVRVNFPKALDYAVPAIIENLRKLAQDENGKPIPFSSVTEEKRSKIKELFFTPLLAQAEIKTSLETISMSGGPQDYLVMVDNYRSKAFGKWDAIGFSGIGDSMKEWILEKAKLEKYLLRSEVVTKAKALLEANGSTKAEEDAGIVATAVVSQGVAKVEKLQRLKQDSIAIINEEQDIIAVKPSATEELVNKLPFDGFPMLEKHSSKILAKLLEKKGQNFTKGDFSILMGDDIDTAIANDSFLMLQAMTRSQGIASYLCERLEIQVSEHKREVMDSILLPLTETVDIEAASKVTTAAELQGKLVTQYVLDMPTVKITIDGKDQLDNFAKDIKKQLKTRIKTVASKVKSSDESTDDRTTAILDDIVEITKGVVTELATLKGTLKVEFQTLSSRMSEDKVPPELIDFIRTATEITVKVVKEKTFADYWDWGAFAVALLGIVQVVAGAAILILTAGAATNIAGALIGEGIGDMMYAATAGLTGTFTWKEYGIQKAISLAVTMGVGLATAGIGTVVSKGAQVAAIATKATIKAVVKAVAKHVTKEIIKAAASYAVGMGAQKLVDLATKGLFNTFKSKFQSAAESNLMCKASVAKVKETLGIMMDIFGADQAEKYMKDAVKDSTTGAQARTGKWDKSTQGSDTKLKDAVFKLAGEFSNSLDAIGSRLEKSGSKWAKTLASASKWIAYATTAAGVLDAIYQIVSFLPAMYNTLNSRLLSIRPKSDAVTPTDVLTGSAREAWIKKNMKVASDAIYAHIEGITASGLTGAAMSELVSRGMDKLYSKSVDKLGRDYDELKMRAEASGAIKKLTRKTELTDLERKQLVTLQTELTDPKNKYPSILETVDPSRNPGMKVMYKGSYSTLEKVTGMLGTKGIQVLPLKSGSACYLIRPKYEDYVSGLTANKQANMFDLHAMAKTANVNVSLIHTENGKDKTTKITPHKDGDVETVKMKLLKNAEYPEGRYVLVDNEGNIKFKHEFETIGSASAAQQLLYAKAYADKTDHKEAMDAANSASQLDTFLEDTRKHALDDESTQDVYLQAEYEAETSILGGSSPHPDMPLVPVPRPPRKRRLAKTRGLTPITTVKTKKVRLATTRGLKKTTGKKKKRLATTRGLPTEETKNALSPDKPLLARAIPLKESGGEANLQTPFLRDSKSRGAIRLKRKNSDLRRLIGSRTVGTSEDIVPSRSIGSRTIGTSEDIVPSRSIGSRTLDTSEDNSRLLTRPSASYASLQRMNDTLKRHNLGESEAPLRFALETESQDDKPAVELEDVTLSFNFTNDSTKGGLVIKWADTPEDELEIFV